ncbi:MAG: hypothetical protein JNJ59_03290 [Deltaproteobacteria bacterium]|nr:hypothetical protein [Deltaproteobacteria bacterium]
MNPTRPRAVLAIALFALASFAGCGDDPASGSSDADTSDTEVAPDVAEVADDADTAEPDADATDTVDPDVADTLAPDVADTAAPDVADTFEPWDGNPGSTERLDEELIPCDEPQYWPFVIKSQLRPLRVHYRVPGDASAARDVLHELETAWRIEVDEIGWAAPLDDHGTCGDDGAFDAFLWRDFPYAYVDVLDDNPLTAWDDGYPYMVIDPFNEFGGNELPATVAHEFNHACQAAYDWNDVTFIYEATSTFMEDEVHDGHNSYATLLFDFQGHPDWSIDRNDDYETWYMYGAMLWLRYLRDRFFEGRPEFIVRLWEGMRSPPGRNEPDYVDSVDALLAPFGRSFADTVLEFARWRWYVRDRDDGIHLEEAGGWPRDAVPKVAATLTSAGGTATVRPMMTGTSYIDVTGTAGQAVTVSLETTVAESSVRFVVQALPGVDGSDGEFLELPARVALTDVSGKVMRTIVVTALPGVDGDIDPDLRTDERFTAAIKVAPIAP